MQIFISKSASGYDKDIFVNYNEIQIATEFDRTMTSHAWHFDDHYYKSIKKLCLLLDKQIDLIPQNNKTIDWWKKYTKSPRIDILFGKQFFVNNLKSVIEDSNKIIQIDETYTNRHYQNQNLLIDSFKNSFVDVNEVKKLELTEQIGILADEKTGMCKVPKYDNWTSITGRMSIIEGPKILTMNKQHRHIFKSSFGEDGLLIGIDFKSLEPRVLFTIAGNDASHTDLYTHIAETESIHGIARETIKVMILSILYGMTRKNFVLKFIDTSDADEIYDKLYDALGIQKIQSFIEKSRVNDQEIRSFYQRRLKCDKSLEVNYYTQSSSVDVACEGFLYFVNDFAQYNNIKQLFMIHDELVVDIHKDKYESLQKYCKNGLKIQSLNCNFPVTTKVFNG